MTWLSGYEKRIKITVDSSKIDSNLTNFPMGITLSSGCGITSQDLTDIFDEVGNDYEKITITSSDGTTVLPTEVEYWSNVDEEAQLWFKASSISSSTDTYFYLYYDATASGSILVSKNTDTPYAEPSILIGDQGTYDTTYVRGFTTIKVGDEYRGFYSGNDGTNDRLIYVKSTDGETWTDHALAINIGNVAAYDSSRVFMSSIIQEDDGSFSIYYQGYGTSGYWSILRATSVSGTTSWTGHQLVMDRNNIAYDTTHIQTPFVMKDGSTYKMWYSGHDGSNGRICYATSNNGTTWSNHQMIIDLGSAGSYDTTHTYGPSVVKDDSGTYHMIYSGSDGSNWRLLYCNSANGTSWSNFKLFKGLGFGGTYDTKDMSYPCLYKDGSKYMLWYDGRSLATSWNKMYSYAYFVDFTLPHQNVWDENFEAVYHMNNDPSDGSGFLKDSTSNEYHGTAAGGMSTTDLIDGRALDFDGGDDNVTDTDPYYLDGFTSGMTITSYVKRHTTAAYMHLTRKYVSSGDQRSWAFYFDNTDYLHMAVTELGSSNTSTSYGDTTSTSTYTDTTDYHTISTTWSTNNYPDLYYDGSSIASSDSYYTPSSIHDGTADLEIGCANFDGEISEIRISSIDRSTAWIKAEHYTFTDNLATYSFDYQYPYDFEGVVQEGVATLSGILVRLYRRSTGELLNSAYTTSSGTFSLGTVYDEDHYVVAFYNNDGRNAVVADWINPSS